MHRTSLEHRSVMIFSSVLLLFDGMGIGVLSSSGCIFEHSSFDLEASKSFVAFRDAIFWEVLGIFAGMRICSGVLWSRENGVTMQFRLTIHAYYFVERIMNCNSKLTLSVLSNSESKCLGVRSWFSLYSHVKLLASDAWRSIISTYNIVWAVSIL